MAAVCGVRCKYPERSVRCLAYSPPGGLLSTEAANKGLSLTLMERAIQLLGKEVVRMLNTQYRMNTGELRYDFDLG